MKTKLFIFILVFFYLQCFGSPTSDAACRRQWRWLPGDRDRLEMTQSRTITVNEDGTYDRALKRPSTRSRYRQIIRNDDKMGVDALDQA